VNELGATLRLVAKFLGGQRIDASAASVSRLNDSHNFAGACQLAGSHQARGTSTNDQNVRQV